MKLLEIDAVVVPSRNTIESAFDFVWSESALALFHGPSLVVSPWSSKADDGNTKSRRTIKFRVDVAEGGVPKEIRRFFCGRSLRVTTQQAVDRSDPTRWTLSNRVRMHFLGAELFRIKPTFFVELDAPSGQVKVGGRVEHHALLPPPLNDIAEGFMMAHSAREIDAFVRGLRPLGPPPMGP